MKRVATLLPTDTEGGFFAYTLKVPEEGDHQFGGSVWRKPEPNLSLDEITRLARSMRVAGSEALGDIHVPAWVDAGRPRLATLDALKFLSGGKLPDKPNLRLSAEWKALSIGPSAAALLAERTEPVREEPSLKAIYRGDDPIRLDLTPDWWRAYSRVRTCRARGTRSVWSAGRSRSEAATGIVTWDGQRLEAKDDDVVASERVGDGNLLPRAINMNDEFLWPLRGMSLSLRFSDADFAKAGGGGALWLEFGSMAIVLAEVRT